MIPLVLRLVPGLLGRFMMGSPSRLGLAGLAATSMAAPYALRIAEHESGGAISERLFDSAVTYIKDKIAAGADLREIENTMDSLDYMVEVNNAFSKSAQNLYVRQIMQQNSGPEAIVKGKIAAVNFQLLPDNIMVLGAKQMIRAAVADDLFPDRNEADRYLANGLINDIVEKAQVRALDGNQVSRADVKNVLADIIGHPEKHPFASQFLNDRGRLMNGLKQEWPDLFPQPVVQQNPQHETSPTPAGAGGDSRSLSQRFNDVVHNNDLNIFSSFNIFLAILLNFLGMDDLSDHFKRAAIMESGETPQPQRPDVNRTPAPVMAPRGP